ncbi:MAG: hypothetical protein R2792_08745 [Saprospiraceae bacterium]
MQQSEKPNTHERIKQKTGLRSPMFIFGGFMTLFYLGLGTAILVNKSFLQGIPVDFRSIFAILLIIYGLYRGYRIFADNR